MIQYLALLALSFATLPDEFVDVLKMNPNIKVELRYFSEWNFMGRAIDGYRANKCFLAKEAAQSLAKVQEHLHGLGYSLLVFDCYRPQRSVAEFVKWVQDPRDLKMKKIFYPDEPKDKLVERGYIASKSGHSRGATVDLTVVKNQPTKNNGKLKYRENVIDCRKPKSIEKTGQLNMGTAFDCFSELANTDSDKVSAEARGNRKILKEAMEKFGFVNYAKEWWHFTLKEEPFKERYFDFVVE